MPEKKIKSIAAILQIVLGLILAAILGLVSGLLIGGLKFITWSNAQPWYSPWNAAWATIAVVAAMILVATWKNSNAHNPQQDAHNPQQAHNSQQEEPVTREDLDAALRNAFEGSVVIACQNGWVSPQILKDKEAEIARLTDQLRSFQHQLASSPDPVESKLSQCLEAGDFDAALREASQQVESVLKEAGNLPRDLYVLGAIHEFRFEWPQALTACRRAWQLSKDSEHGFKYAYLAQKLNHSSEAIAAYEALILVYFDPAQRAATLNNLGLLYSDTQDMKQAEKVYDEALTIRRKLAQAKPGAYRPDVAATLDNLANLYCVTQRMNQAEEAYTETLGIRRNLAQANPGVYLPDVATTLDNLANLYCATQRMNQAEWALAEALTIRRKLAQANPDAYRPSVSTTLNNLACFCLSAGRIPEAETYAFRAEGILDPLWQADPELHGNQMARILWTRTLVSEASQQPAAEACALARRALAAANDPALKQSTQQFIDRTCPASQS